MNIEQLHDYCLAKSGTMADFPFDADTLVFKVLDKVFALISLEKWEAGNKSINLKCEPDYAQKLRAEYESISPGYHMNKKHWNTIDFTKNDISSEFLRELIDHSYDRVVLGMSKKMSDSLQ